MKQSLSITSLYKRGGSIDPISGAAAAEDNAASATILDKANNSSALSLGPAGVSNPAGPSLSLAVSSPMSGSEDATLPISPWRKVLSKWVPAGSRARRLTAWMVTALYSLWLPGYLRPEKVRMVDLEMLRSDLPFHAQDRLHDLGLWQVLSVIRYGFVTSVVRELFRRARAEFWVEIPLIQKKFWPLLLCGSFQYVHAIFTQLAFYMHRPLPNNEILHDTGFDIFPELGRPRQWVSESVFGFAFACFVVWTLTPFVTSKKRFYTVILYARWLMILTMCQSLRIASFLATQLPAPNYHCRSSEFTVVHPQGIKDILVVNLKRQTTHGCGDLIFSSHTTFALSFVLFYSQYGSYRLIKGLSWVYVFVLSCLIVASRKHYTVDIVIAWYTVPLVFFYMTKRWKIIREPLTKTSLPPQSVPTAKNGPTANPRAIVSTGMSTGLSAANAGVSTGMSTGMSGANAFASGPLGSAHGSSGDLTLGVGGGGYWGAEEGGSGSAGGTANSLGRTSSSGLPLPPRPPVIRTVLTSTVSSPKASLRTSFFGEGGPALPLSTSPSGGADVSGTGGGESAAAHAGRMLSFSPDHEGLQGLQLQLQSQESGGELALPVSAGAGVEAQAQMGGGAGAQSPSPMRLRMQGGSSGGNSGSSPAPNSSAAGRSVFLLPFGL